MWDPSLPSQIAQSSMRYATPQERRAFIANACQGDAALQQQALVNLAAYEGAAFQNPALSNPALSSPALSNPALQNPAFQNPVFHNPALSNPALALPSRPLPGMPMAPSGYPGAAVAKPKGNSRKTLMMVGGIVGGVALVLLLIASPFLYGGYRAWSLSSTETKAADFRKFGKFKESALAYEQLLPMYKSKYGVDHEKTVAMMGKLGEAYYLAGMLDKAKPLLIETAELQKAKFGPADSKTINTLVSVANVLKKEKKVDEELAFRESIIKTMHENRPANDYGTAQCLDLYIDACVESSQRPRSLAAQEELVDIFRMQAGANSPQTQSYVVRLVTTYAECGKPDKAISLAEANLSTIKQLFGDNSSQNLEALQGLAKACDVLQRKEDAIKWRQAYEEAKRAPPTDPYSSAYPPGGAGS